MRSGTCVLGACVLVLGLSASAGANIMPGTWDTDTSGLLTGSWVELFGPAGPGQPGAELSAEADDAMQWMLSGIHILSPAVGNDNGDGTITYTTDYGNENDPGMSALVLAEAPTLWGDAMTFTNLVVTVEATVDMATGMYLGGAFNGSADGTLNAAGVRILIGGPLSETAVYQDPDPPGHEGTVDYLEVTILPIMPSLDIKPVSCPNAFKPRRQGKLPVGLLGTMDFDVANVDVTTIVLSRADGVGGSVAPLEGPRGPHTVIADVGTPFIGEECECHEMYGDGIMDLSMKFSRPMVVDALELYGFMPGDEVPLVLTAYTSDGGPIMATDCIVIRGGKMDMGAARDRGRR